MMRRKFLKALAVCLILLLTCTAVYAKEGNAAANRTKQGHQIPDKNKDHKQDKESGVGNHGSEHHTKKMIKGNKKSQGGIFVPVTGITLNKTTTTLDVKSWERLTATVQPANATDKKYFWFSGNPRVASVNPSGKITGLAPGTAVIYVATRDGFKTASCTVTVEGVTVPQVRVTGIRLSDPALTLDVGHGKQLIAAVIPGNASNKAIIWQSSNPAVATVNQNGYVYGIDDGTAAITVCTADGGKTATCVVTVRHGNQDIHVTSVSIIKSVSTIALKEGAVKRLVMQVLPENASNKELIWRTSNTDIVSVDQDGDLTGVHEGTATITVTSVDGSKTDTCTVRVISADEWVRVTGITLNLVNITIPTGFTDTLRYQIGPSDASDQDVRWSSSNSGVAAVNALGKIQAKAAGIAVITATTVDGSKTASCLVVVTPSVKIPSRGILFNKTISTTLVGEHDYPAVIIYPANGGNYYLTWASSDTSVASVDQSGIVTARGQGTAVITVRTSNNWTASYLVNVIE